MKKQHIISLCLLLAVFAYAILRYNILKGTPWVDLPLFISNKALSLAAVLFISLSYLLGPLKRLFPNLNQETLSWRKEFGLIGFALAAIHSLISLLLFSPAYYDKFFEESGRLNATGSFSMIFGICALVLFTLVSISSLKEIQEALGEKSWLKIQKIGLFGFILVLLHVLVMGYQGWMDPSLWPGGLLPISLLAAIAILLTQTVRTLAKIKK